MLIVNHKINTENKIINTINRAKSMLKNDAT